MNSMKSYNIFTVSKYLIMRPINLALILRHDIDLDINYAIKMASLENAHDIKATYYIRFRKNVMVPDKVKAISDLGHEVGYHYEILSKANGDHKKAKIIFESELSQLNKISDVKTISMHGNPLSPFLNTDFWRYYDFNEFNIIGDAQLSISDLPYFTDTGGLWNSSNNNRDFIYNNLASKNINTNQLIKLINTKYFPNLYINCHPERWAKGNLDKIGIKFRDFFYNIGKKIVHAIGRAS